MFSCFWLLCNPMDSVVHQASLSMEFSRQEYWSKLWFPSPEDLPNPGIEPVSPTLAGSWATGETQFHSCNSKETGNNLIHTNTERVNYDTWNMVTWCNIKQVYPNKNLSRMYTVSQFAWRENVFFWYLCITHTHSTVDSGFSGKQHFQLLFCMLWILLLSA